VDLILLTALSPSSRMEKRRTNESHDVRLRLAHWALAAARIYYERRKEEDSNQQHQARDGAAVERMRAR